MEYDIAAAAMQEQGSRALDLIGFFIPFLVITPLMATKTAAAYDAGFLAIVLFIAAISLAAIALTETGTRAYKNNK